MHLEGLLVGLGLLHSGQLLLFFLQPHSTDVARQDNGTNDAQYTKWIGTGVCRSNLRGIGAEYRRKGLVGGTKTGGVGHSTVERTHHHGKGRRVAGVEEDVVADEHHEDVERDGRGSEAVELHASLAKALEETWTHLQANHKDKEDEAEVLDECQDVRRCCLHSVIMEDMPGDDARKEHEGDAERDAKDFNLSQIDTDGNHNGVE